MSCITFNYNKNIIYAIIYWVLEIITRMIMYLNWKIFEIVEKDAINEYLYVIMLNISDLLAGFLVLYIHYSFKKKNPVENNDNISANSKSIKIIEGEVRKVHKSKYFIFKIVLICCLDYLCRSAFFIFYQIFDARHIQISDKIQKDMIIHLDIIARYIFSIVILKLKIFKHHKVAIFIIIAGFCILCPTDIISLEVDDLKDQNVDNIKTYIYIAIFSLRGILFPLEDTIVKIIFTNDYIIPEQFMFVRGIVELIIIIIVTPILYIHVWNYNVFDANYSGRLTSIIFFIIFYIFSSFVKGLVLLKVIYYFSSQSVSFLIISESITGSIAAIINYFKPEQNKKYSIIILIIEVIVIFISMTGTLIYDEIIIIKKWGMEVNVAKEITKRGVFESSTIEMIDNNYEEEGNED